MSDSPRTGRPRALDAAAWDGDAKPGRDAKIEQLLLLGAAAILSTAAVPAAAERFPEPPEVGSNIVGGSPAGPQQFPFAAALSNDAG